MKYYIDAHSPDTASEHPTVFGFTLEADNAFKAVLRFADFQAGITFTGLGSLELDSIRNKPTRGVNYKELLR